MKRLRLRKIWVVLAVLALMTPLLSGRLEKTDAAAPTGSTAETTTEEPLTGQMKIWFKTGYKDDAGNEGADLDFVDKDGTSTVQWNMKVSDSNRFNNPNTGYLEAFLSINGKQEGDWKKTSDRVKWEYVIDTADYDKIMTVGELDSSSDGSKNISFNVKAAGIISVYIRAVGYDEVTDPNASGAEQVFKDIDGDTKYYVASEKLDLNRTIYIGSPLQIYAHKQSAAPTRVLLKTGDLGSDASKALNTKETIYANNAAIDTCNIAWFYIGAETNSDIELQVPVGGKDGADIPDNLSRYQSSDMISLSDKGSQETTVNNVSVFPYEVSITNKGKAGFVRLIGRIYLNGDPSSNIYIEQSFDVLVASEIKDGTADLKNLTMKYGEKKLFSDISNDAGRSLEWTSFKNYNTEADDNSVLILKEGDGFTANNYGLVTLESTSIYKNYENYDHFKPSVTDTVEVVVEAALLKGEKNKQIVSETMEVINVGGTITLSTNIVGSKSGEYKYEWNYDDGSQTPPDLTADNGGYENEYFSAAGMTVVNTGNYSSIKVTGKKSGEDIKVICKVTKQGEPDAFFTKEVIIHIADTMSLSESKKVIAVGGSFTLSAITSVNNGSTVTWTVAEEDQEFLTAVSSGDKSAVITGLKSTDGRWITVTATQEINGTTVSAACQVKVIPGISGAEIIATPSSTISVGGLADLELILDTTGTNFTEDEIKWVLKDKDGVSASEIIDLKPDAGNILNATVKGLSVGEAYVAVVTNDTAQVEIAVITIRVVSEVTGIQLNKNEVLDYLNESGTGSYQLTYTLLPEGYVDEELPVVWATNNENVATVDQDGLVTYHGVGTVIITASISGLPAIADTCTFVIENPATGLELDPTSLNMKVGQTAQITATVSPETVTDATITWTSADESVATVDRYGLVKAVAAGSTFIKATTTNGLEATCIVTVLTPADSITLNYSSITVKKNTVFYLSAQVGPVDAYDKSVTFTSSDEDIVTVEQDGTVTAVNVGVAEITVTSNDNPEVSEVCIVTVVEAVSGLTLNSREITIDVGEQYLLKATVRPSDAVNNAVTFESADPSIATVDENGLITGVKGGTTVVIVKTVERGLMASCTVTVQEDISSITLSETETYVAKGKNKRITATILPESATNKKLLWTSSDESIVIVDAEGNIHGVNLGTAIITATAQDDGKVFATCKVTVVDATTKITLNQSIIRIMQKDTYQLTYTIEPNYATVKQVTWSTSNASVARVDSLGLVTGVGEGEAKIRATAADGSGVYAECTVIVTPLIPVTSVRVDTVATTMVVGDSRTMTARVMPRDTTERIRWVSEDTSVVTIDSNGNLRAVGPGVAQVTAISSLSGIEGSSTITVLGLNASDVTLEQYDTFDLYLDGVTTGVTWFSRNKRVATVSRRGVVTARREGTTEVVARVNGKLVSCAVNVEKLGKLN